ncbi:pentatricopeptide repeat-containing protein chloroplastic-like [Dorcoceras hygrometricum]|uniref:Pentatricopeptide repeat-containing protein chloroplastic-like n=1 Tax=Dorcoceras hygrometricum TaxID=472368 RepID=A0A2Z7CSJ0_9LAMI|nr:pentatricopeptide repeat-containing protein chloroplastic-like [Dorcoceras hygrometricum]
MVWMRCMNGTREQASNTVALDEKNRVKLVKDKPAQTEEDQLEEEKTGSGDLVKLDAYERDGRRNVEARVYDRIMEEDSYGERSNQLGRKRAGKQAQSQQMFKSSKEQNKSSW